MAYIYSSKIYPLFRVFCGEIFFILLPICLKRLDPTHDPTLSKNRWILLMDLFSPFELGHTFYGAHSYYGSLDRSWSRDRLWSRGHYSSPINLVPQSSLVRDQIWHNDHYGSMIDFDHRSLSFPWSIWLCNQVWSHDHLGSWDQFWSWYHHGSHDRSWSSDRFSPVVIVVPCDWFGPAVIMVPASKRFRDQFWGRMDFVLQHYGLDGYYSCTCANLQYGMCIWFFLSFISSSFLFGKRGEEKTKKNLIFSKEIKNICKPTFKESKKIKTH